jgi:hypothetical protein
MQRKRPLAVTGVDDQQQQRMDIAARFILAVWILLFSFATSRAAEIKMIQNRIGIYEIQILGRIEPSR